MSLKSEILDDPLNVFSVLTEVNSSENLGTGQFEPFSIAWHFLLVYAFGNGKST